MSAFQGLRRSVAAINARNHVEVNILIQEEKDVMKTIKETGKEKLDAGKYLANWGRREHEDIEDITSKFESMTEEFNKFHLDLVDSYDEYRCMFKDIRNREDEIYAKRKRVKELQDKLKECVKKNKPVDVAKADLSIAEEDLAALEADSEGYKRKIFKDAMHYYFDAYRAYSQKLAIMAQFGKYLADQIPQGMLAPGQPLPSFEGAPTTTRIYSDFLKALRSLESNSITPTGKDTNINEIPELNTVSDHYVNTGVSDTSFDKSDLSIHQNLENFNLPIPDSTKPSRFSQAPPPSEFIGSPSNNNISNGNVLLENNLQRDY